MTELNLALPDDVQVPDLATALAAGLVVEEDGSTPVRRRYFDSFDWRLHRAGLALVREDGRWRLRRLDDDTVELETAAGGGRWPRFASEFPAGGGLRKRLDKLLKMRAVIHVATVAGDQRRWRVLNADRKTVLRFDLTALQPEKPASDRVLRVAALRPVRGYDGAADRARAEAARLGVGPLDLPFLDTVLAAIGIEAESYSSRFCADLTDTPESLAAAVRVSRTLLGTMRRNEAGLKTDLDTEFLHDFRVAVRRQRSALTIFKGVFDPAAIDGFKREFAALGRLTGPLRDLDVYLLDEARYRDMVPGALQSGLDSLFEHLREQRAGALTQVRRALGSPAYRGLTDAWDTFLADPQPGPIADRPTGDLARERLQRRHHRVMRMGRAIGSRTPDTALHRLRIECKKLRYLLEFFASLWDADEGKILVDQLKDLQDNLGEFNDLCVQQEMLRAALGELTARRKSALLEAASLGGLVAVLNARQQVVRGEFEATFAAFSRPRITKRFARLASSAEDVA